MPTPVATRPEVSSMPSAAAVVTERCTTAAATVRRRDFSVSMQPPASAARARAIFDNAMTHHYPSMSAFERERAWQSRAWVMPSVVLPPGAAHLECYLTWSVVD